MARVFFNWLPNCDKWPQTYRGRVFYDADSPDKKPPMLAPLFDELQKRGIKVHHLELRGPSYNRHNIDDVRVWHQDVEFLKKANDQFIIWSNVDSTEVLLPNDGPALYKPRPGIQPAATIPTGKVQKFADGDVLLVDYRDYHRAANNTGKDRWFVRIHFAYV